MTVTIIKFFIGFMALVVCTTEVCGYPIEGIFTSLAPFCDAIFTREVNTSSRIQEEGGIPADRDRDFLANPQFVDTISVVHKFGSPTPDMSAPRPWIARESRGSIGRSVPLSSSPLTAFHRRVASFF